LHTLFSAKAKGAAAAAPINDKKRRLRMSKKNTTPPSHRFYAVTKNGKRNHWQPIGAIWPHADGEGFSVQLDYLPLNGAEIVIRKLKPPKTEAEAEQADAPADEIA
jgi:hypothetical protein